MNVRLDPNAPDGFVVYSHAGDDWKVCREYVRQRLGLPAWEPGNGRNRTIPKGHTKKWDLATVESEGKMQERTEDDLHRIARADKLWNEALNPRRTAAEKYLASRRLGLTEDITNSALRFHPTTPWRDENTGQTIYIPCLLAAFRSIDDDKVTAIHRIRVDQPGRWPKTDRRMLGLVRRSAVKLGAPSKTLVIGEGVETCMAARELGVGSYALALGSVGAISFFPILPDIRTLIILAETGSASTEAVAICRKRWEAAYRAIKIVSSNVGSDVNDALMAAAR
jgi:hypothetical protein